MTGRARFAAIFTVALAALSLGIATEVHAQEQERTPSPEGALVYIVSPENGETVSGPVTVVFGLTGMGVAPAGIRLDDTGHHHLLVNTPLPAMDAPLPGNENSIHFGGGQTETVLDLPPGEHTLRLVLGDWRHVPHDPPVVSEPVTIVVE
jgi:hypothetical protein